MNAIQLLPAPEGRAILGTWNVLARESDSAIEICEKAELAAANVPEALLTIQFVGLTAVEQARALASFPGARRCVVAQGR